MRESVGGHRTTRLVSPGDARAPVDALAAVTESWSTVARSLAGNREEVIRRHDPGAYRTPIVRACRVNRGARRIDGER